MNNHFNKKILYIIVSIIVISSDLYAWGLRVDIRAPKQKMELAPAEGTDGNLKNATWGDEAYRKRYLFYQAKDLPKGEMVSREFTFIPSKTGEVEISLKGCWQRRKGMSQNDKGWVEYLKVESEGKEILNGKFNEYTDGGRLKYWIPRNDSVILQHGVRVWYDAPLIQIIKVKAGQPVKIKLEARDGGEELAMAVSPPPLILIKHKDWELTVDSRSGVWKNLKWQGQSIFSNPEGALPFSLDGEYLKAKRTLKSHSFDPESGVAKIITSNGMWTFEERLSFGKRIKREVFATFNGQEPVKFRSFNFFFYLPLEGKYYFPRSLFGDLRSYMQIVEDPLRVPENSGQIDKMKKGTSIQGVPKCYFSFIQQAPSRTLMFTFDGRREVMRASLKICRDYAVNQIRAETRGWAMPGEPQLIGPAYIEVFRGDIQAALRSAPHEWFKDVNMLPPQDRPEWSKDITSVLSFCPNASNGGVYGFREATKTIIPYAKKLGINAFWILPLQITAGSLYAIRDYYKFRPEIGSSEDYKDFLKNAKENGFYVWQDIIPHGMLAEYGLLRGVSPFTACITEQGEFYKRQAFDYGSSEWRKYICNVAEYYLKNYPIDGFRIDQPHRSPANWRRPGFPAKAPKLTGPEWWDPEDVKWWNKSVTKWWNDAVAKNGGKVPSVEGGRASFSNCEAGAIITKEIRDAVRKIRPNGSVLAETDDIACVPSGDFIFDFYIRRVGLKMSFFAGEMIARNLSRYLEEQKLTDPPGTIRLRFLEVHDVPTRLVRNQCGTYAGHALRSSIFWSQGIPLLLIGAITGEGALIQRLNAIRSALPEFRYGKVNYMAVNSSPAVFAALRELPEKSSIGITSFLPETVKTTLHIPVDQLGFAPGTELVLYNSWDGKKLAEGKLEVFKKIELELPAYGNAVLTWRPIGTPAATDVPEQPDFSALPSEALALKETTDEIIVNGPQKLVIDRKNGLLKSFGDYLDGSSILSDQPLSDLSAKVDAKLENGLAVINAELTCGVRLSYILNGAELKISGILEKFSKNDRYAFVLAATGAERWQVNSIEGTLDDFIDKTAINPDFIPTLPISFISYRPEWSPILWHSEIKPLNPASPWIRIFNKKHSGFDIALSNPLSNAYDDMMLWDRLPGESGLHAAIFWVQPGPLSLATSNIPRSFQLTISPAKEMKPAAPLVSNGVKIMHESLSWHLENDKYDLFIARKGGCLKELKAKNGKIVFSDQDVVAGKNIAKPMTRASADFETGVRCFSEDGKLKLRFISAIRSGNNYGLPNAPAWVLMEYALNKSEQLLQSCRLYAESLKPFYKPNSSLLHGQKIAYVIRKGAENIELPLPGKNEKLKSREFFGFSVDMSASGKFEKGPAKKITAANLGWKRFFQIYSTGREAAISLMVASSIPGNALDLWRSLDTHFTPGYKAPVAIETKMPGYSYLGNFIDLKPGKYKMKTWIKGKDIAKKRGRSAILMWAKWFENGKLVCKKQSLKIPQGSFDWFPFEIEFEIPEGATMPVSTVLRTSFDAAGEGTVWVDLHKLEKVEHNKSDEKTRKITQKKGVNHEK